jgi:putative glutathione S-transferase
MGQLIDGVWHIEDRRAGSDGRFVRAESRCREWITADGSSGYKAEAGRYHLIISLACPWAHRALIVRRLKGLEQAVTLSIVDPDMGDQGWVFSDYPGSIPDPLFGADKLFEIYTHADPAFSGRVTVPVLWDRERATIVNNESSEIIRMFNSAFVGVATDEPDLCPKALRPEIDAVNERVFTDINNGVYRTGFATAQAAYEEAFDQLFAALDWVEARLAETRYLCGDAITEADWRLFTTLVRFDPVYVGHFKCNLRRIADYPNLSNYLRELYQVPGVAETCDFEHIKGHYFGSHTSINPTRIVPKGPEMDLSAPHDRDRL